ncbi:MAG: TraB/GumN family protein, partial [Lachnospiraceae bacterium]|nr:TraB/GumN family protein [Lachnospiraceae bacterium]
DEELGKELEKAIKKYGGELYMTLLNYNLSTLTTYLEQVMLPLGRSQSYERGVDNQLVELAKQNEIPVWDVEDYAEHLTLLANFSEELQRLILKETLQSGRYSSNLASAEMFELWCRGDEEEIFRAIEEETKEEEDITEEEKALTEEYNEAMMLKRNAQMLEKAKEYMASGQRVFFAVGLAHLTGEKGLVEGLKAAGYSLNQVKYAP